MELQVALPNMSLPPRSYRAQVVEALATFRHEWQKSADGESLLNVETNVGLLLYDVANCLGLGEQEQAVLLGTELLQEIQATISQPLETRVSQ